MFVVLVLFCLVNFAGCLQINVQQATVSVLKDQDAVLKWTFTKNSGESITNGQIQLLPSGSPQQIKNVVLIPRQDVATVLGTYRTSRQWTASFSSREITLRAKDCKPEDDGTYVLTLYVNVGVSHEAKNIILEVLVLPYFPTGTFTASPQTFTEGVKVTLKCEPDGSPKPIVIEWIKNNVPLVIKNSNDPNLVMSNVSRNDAGTYECRARNKAGPAIQIPKIEVTIHYKPVNTKFNVTSVLVDGQSGELKCSAEAEPKAKYTIGGGGFEERTGSGIYSLGKILRSHDTKVVKCTPQNKIGIGQIVTLTLDVKAVPKILDKLPNEMNVIEGRNFSIKCSASGKPPAKIVWTKDGSPVRNPPQSLVDVKLADNTYRSLATLKLAPVTRRDNGKYACEATNPYGRDTEYVDLNLLFLPEVTNTRDFKDREERVGSTVDLDCIANGNPKATYYVWRWPNRTVIQNKTEGKLKIYNIQANEGGYISCAGVSYLGEGKKQYIKLFVQVPPRIIVAPVRRVSLNDSDRLLLFCNASGVPKPTIKWSRDGTILRRTGELLSIDSVKYTDDGEYTCTATNGIEPNDTALTDVTIYFRPVIVSNTATYTIKGADSGEEVQFVCTAEARPVANFKWLHFPSRLPVSESEADVIRIKQTNDNVFLLEVKARIGAKYLCHAYNNRGNSSQLYEIRARGTPEAPVLNEVRTYIYTAEGKVSTVRAYVKWTPGYDGGQNVWYKISYGKQAKVPDQTTDIRADCNCYIITELEADKDYVFFVRAHNNAGPSNHSNIFSVKTKAFYGKAFFERLDEGKIVRVKFVRFTQDNVTKIVVKYRESKTQDFWTGLDVLDSQKELLIKDLDPEKSYKFQVLWSVGEKQQITDGEVSVWNPPETGGRTDNSLSREEIIAIIAGVGGFILIVILILFLCLIRRRQKPKRDEAVVVMRRQAPGSVTTDIVTRRSLIGSVEDDPFESAHYGSQDKKKGKARDSYYLPGSEDLNTFSTDNTARHSVNPAENSQAYQPYRFGDQSTYQNQDDRSSSEDESLPYNGRAGQKRFPSDEELTEPGYAHIEDLKGRSTRDNVEPSQERPKPNKNDVYAKVKKRNNNRPATNGRGAPPPYRPRSTADAPRNLPPYHPDDDDDDDGDQLDLDDPSAVPYDDPLPPPMPVLQSPHSVPDDMWDNRYPEDPRDSVDSTLERKKSPSRTSLPGKPYRNVHGKLVRPSSSGRLSSSAEEIDDSQQRSPEPEVPSGRSSRHLDLDSDERNLVSYLV